MKKYRKKLIGQLKSVTDGAKDMVMFEDIALSFFDSDNISSFFRWKEKNKERILNEFEQLCEQHDCIYQQCNFGPRQGNYWIAKRHNNYY